MAQTSKVNALIDELVVSFARAASDGNTKRLKSAKDVATKSAKAQQYVRTNQFEVESTLNGLVEKFSIIGREDLAVALNKRLDELRARSRSKWTPEILQLFLCLSDRPDQKSSLEALELLRPPIQANDETVTWEDLEREEPLKGELWEDEAYSSASEDEVVLDEKVKGTARSKLADNSSLATSQGPKLTESVATHIYTDVKNAQFWRQTDLRSSRPQLQTELQVIREVLFMLRALPTSLFAIDEKNMLVYLVANVMIEQISLSGLNDVLQAFASVGTDTLRLRKWTEKVQTVPLPQTFEAGIRGIIIEFNERLASIEEKFVGQLSVSTVTSILNIWHQVESFSRPIIVLTNLVSRLPTTGADFMCLELLYNELCALQAAGDEQCFEVLARIFFNCLNIYLRPISLWMEQGTILDGDATFFIATADKSSALSSMWHDGYTLKITTDDTLHAPKFLAPAAKKILNAGKSIVFLQQLHKNLPTSTNLEKTLLTYESVLGQGHGLPLLPFSELLSTAFSAWLDCKYGPASTILKKHLLHQCRLLDHINSLSHVYFSADGTLFQNFADEVLKRFHSQKNLWNDKYALTESARRCFGKVHGLRTSSLSARSIGLKHPKSTQSIRALEDIVLDVNLPWSIQNIIQRTSASVYQSIFTLLLQVYYAEYLLRSHMHHLRANHGNLGTTRLSIGIHHSLTWFANTIHSYILDTVVHPGIEKLQRQLITAGDVDAMCSAHEGFVKDSELKCLLKSNLSPIYDSIIGILDLAVVLTQSDKDEYRSEEQKVSVRKRKSKSQANNEEEDSSSGDEDEVNARPERGASSTSQLPTAERLRSLQDKFAQLLHFMIAGLRGVSRAGGQVEWEMLAERLEWGMYRKKREFDYV